MLAPTTSQQSFRRRSSSCLEQDLLSCLLPVKESLQRLMTARSYEVDMDFPTDSF